MLSMMDRLWRPDLGEQEALELMKKGVDEVKKRLVVAPPDYQIKVGWGLGKLPGCALGLSILMLRSRSMCCCDAVCDGLPGRVLTRCWMPDLCRVAVCFNLLHLGLSVLSCSAIAQACTCQCAAHCRSCMACQPCSPHNSAEHQA